MIAQCQSLCVPHAALKMRRPMVHKKLGVDTARTAEPKGYPIPCGAVLSNKSWGKERGRVEVRICQ